MFARSVALLAEQLRVAGHDPVVLRGGMSAGQRRNALERLQPAEGPLLVVATGPYVGEGFDCPALDTLFLAAPIAFKGRLVQYVGRILRPAPGKHDGRGARLPRRPARVLASSLAQTSAGLPQPRLPRPELGATASATTLDLSNILEQVAVATAGVGG